LTTDSWSGRVGGMWCCTFCGCVGQNKLRKGTYKNYQPFGRDMEPVLRELERLGARQAVSDVSLRLRALRQALNSQSGQKEGAASSRV